MCVCAGVGVCERGGVKDGEGIDCRRSSSGVGWIVIATDV